MAKKDEALLIFPTQLFKKHQALAKEKHIFLIEAPRYFTNFAFHKKKLVLHRASMKAYYDYLKEKDYFVTYISFDAYKTLKKKLKSFEIVHYIDPVDIPFEEQLLKTVLKGLEHKKHETSAFLSSIEWLTKTLGNKKSYRAHTFYLKQRKQLDILMTKNNKPMGGRWTFDQENRQTIPEELVIPDWPSVTMSTYVQEAQRYVNKHFKNNPGSTDDFAYPVTHKEATTWFSQFLKKRFAQFGPYQDAIVKDEPLLFHSLLSPLLNTGLLTPDEVVWKSLDYAKKHKIPLNSVEGFIRQIIGWREFVRGVYLFSHKTMRTKNFFKAKKTLPKSFWKATTGVLPVDTSIEKVIEFSYVHHIERLMILGNFMLLCQFKPDEVYTWFMELFIDAYDWVMVPNVYGMSQFADGGLMTTKPYISSSNYLLKMSDFKKNEWSDIWDSLYWYFLYKNKKRLSSIPRVRLMYSHLKKMKKATLDAHCKQAKAFLRSLK